MMIHSQPPQTVEFELGSMILSKPEETFWDGMHDWFQCSRIGRIVDRNGGQTDGDTVVVMYQV